MTRVTKAGVAGAWLWAALAAQGAAAQSPASPAARTAPAAPVVRLVFDDHPELRVGEAVRVEFRVKLQGDVRGFSPEPSNAPDAFDVPLARVGVEGRLTRYVEYEVAYELTDPEDGWRSVFINLRPVDLFQVQGGHFKVPFSRERLTGPASLDFTRRAVGVRVIAPGYDTGVMAHGRFDKRMLTYAVGIFEGGRDTTASLPEPPGLPPLQDNPERLVAWRVTARPLAALRRWKWIRPIEVGINGTRSQVDEGRHGWEGEAAFGDTFFGALYVNGRRTRLGADVSIETGPVHLQAEWLRGRDERRGQGMESDDLPDLEVRDWYVGGTVVVIGGTRRDLTRPPRPLFGGGVGAVEVGVRREQLSFGSVSGTGEPSSTSPRSANVAGNRDTVWTAGANWYPARFVRVQTNAIRERFDDPRRTPLEGRDTFWSWVVRLQFAL